MSSGIVYINVTMKYKRRLKYYPLVPSLTVLSD